MNYELAKQLKDAGFPQDKSDDRIFPDETRTGYGQKIADVCVLPTLSGLIEAIEENTAHNGFKSLTTDGYGWDAEANSGKEGSGQTPEEACANLWLALHGKD